jgi:hypothetical protein
LIVLGVQALIVAALVLGSQMLTASRNAKTPLDTYVYQNIYFEYPGNWEIKLNETGQGGELTVTPAPGSPEAKMLGTFYIMFMPEVVFDENWKETLSSEASCSGKENTQWHQMIEGETFSGFECVWKNPEDTFPSWEFFLYNEQEQMAVSILALPINNTAAEALQTAENAANSFPGILEIAESLRISDQ